MVGSAIIRNLEKHKFSNLITHPRSQLDLLNQAAVRDFLQSEKPDCVIIAAAKVGGIHANNTYPADFIYENLIIECNLIHESYKAGVNNLLFLGSSCIYPGKSPQPIKEEYLLSGPLEATNEPYAVAKIAGIKLCESYNRQYGTNYRSVMPTNLYGPGDNFSLQNSHVIPALLRKFHEAKVEEQPYVEVWGSGKPFREFLYVDDMADACRFIMMLDDAVYQQNTSAMLSHINIGVGRDVAISDLAKIMKKITGYQGDIRFNHNMPDGTKRKLLDVSRLTNMGWQATISLEDGLVSTYQWYLKNINGIRT